MGRKSMSVQVKADALKVNAPLIGLAKVVKINRTSQVSQRIIGWSKSVRNIWYLLPLTARNATEGLVTQNADFDTRFGRGNGAGVLPQA
jgi:hypothetical protein